MVKAGTEEGEDTSGKSLRLIAQHFQRLQSLSQGQSELFLRSFRKTGESGRLYLHVHSEATCRTDCRRTGGNVTDREALEWRSDRGSETQTN